MQVPGFVPAAEVLLFRQKDPKPCWPWCGPSGSLRSAADSGVAQTRYAQTMRDFYPVSAALLGHTTRPGETAETMCPLIIVD